MRRSVVVVGWLGLLIVGVASAATVDRRLRNRLGRDYRRYEVKLSMHDDAKPGDLEDMVEAIGAAVRKRYNDRVSQGQEIGAVGQTGGVDRPQLHFEARYAASAQEKARPVDPMAVLP